MKLTDHQVSLKDPEISTLTTALHFYPHRVKHKISTIYFAIYLCPFISNSLLKITNGVFFGLFSVFVFFKDRWMDVCKISFYLF